MENDQLIKKIKEWQLIVNKGLNNGLSHTHQDGRLNDIEFWRRRSCLFNIFALCVMHKDEMHEKELIEIAERGYSNI